MLFVAARNLLVGRPRQAMLITGIGIVGIVVLLTTALGTIVLERGETGHSDAGRASLYTQAIDLTIQSPLVGYGAPVPNPKKLDGPSIGTHGQFWLVMVTTGFPGIVLYILFFAGAVRIMWRWKDPLAIWGLATLLMGLISFWIYEQLPTELPIMMVWIAAAARSQHAEAIDRAVAAP